MTTIWAAAFQINIKMLYDQQQNKSFSLNDTKSIGKSKLVNCQSVNRQFIN